jgi:hypothetical protein
MRTRTDHLGLMSADRHHGPARSLRAEILILTARINFNP